MKVKNLDLKELSLIHYDKVISFDEEGLSEDLADGVAKELATLPGYELVKEKKPEAKKTEAKKEVKKAPTKTTEGK